jgi:anaerobic magnesium-protoporphyrin IX monomethyl ester cyclase
MAVELCIKLIALEKGITCIGLRRISSLIKSKYPNTTTYIYDLAALSSKTFLKSWILSRAPKKVETVINEKLVQELTECDVLGVSCVSLDADKAKQLINLVKEKNPKTLVVWGGVHATLNPEDAINYADIVCIGEGEKSIMVLLNKIKQKEDFSALKGLWVRQNGKVSKNEFMPLMDKDELSQMPFQDYGFDIKYVTHNSMKFMTKSLYMSILGSTYNTMWVMGCPYCCSYCANNKLLAINTEYEKLRHASAEFIIKELTEVRKIHNYINYVILMDDNISMLKKPELKHFAELWRNEIGLPLFIPGFSPSTVDGEKVDILVNAGMNKVRMGIQSGSERILSFYGRKTSRQQILKSAEILSSFYPRISPPNYDIIIDNPIETMQDKEATLSLLRELKRPFMLYTYSLRKLPGTRLWDFSLEHPEYDFKSYSQPFQFVDDRWMGIMVYMLGIYNPPESVYRVWNGLAKNEHVNRILFPLVRIAYLIKRFYHEMRTSNFEVIANVSPTIAKAVVKIMSIFNR